jgi:hypothetical protein
MDPRIRLIAEGSEGVSIGSPIQQDDSRCHPGSEPRERHALVAGRSTRSSPEMIAGFEPVLHLERLSLVGSADESRVPEGRAFVR